MSEESLCPMTREEMKTRRNAFVEQERKIEMIKRKKEVQTYVKKFYYIIDGVSLFRENTAVVFKSLPPIHESMSFEPYSFPDCKTISGYTKNAMTIHVHPEYMEDIVNELKKLFIDCKISYGEMEDLGGDRTYGLVIDWS